MKKNKLFIGLLLFVLIITTSCKQKENFYADDCNGCEPFYIPNKYILTEINSEVISDENETFGKYIDLNLSGLLVSEFSENDTEFVEKNIPGFIEKQYFINIIKDISIFYDDTVNCEVFFNTNHSIYNERTRVSSIIGRQLGYSPRSLYLKNIIPSGHYVFKIQITDKYDNTFTTQTDTIIIEN